jgi:hypothetical protein
MFDAGSALRSAAMTRLHAADVLVASGRRAEAGEHLQQALAFFRSVGATRYARAGEALLAASAWRFYSAGVRSSSAASRNDPLRTSATWRCWMGIAHSQSSSGEPGYV